MKRQKATRSEPLRLLAAMFIVAALASGSNVQGDPLTQFTASDAFGGDNLGYAVAIKDGRALVGIQRPTSGNTYVFDADPQSSTFGNELIKLAPAIAPSAGAFFGESVATDGVTALIGARAQREEGVKTGAAYLFDTNPQSPTFGDELFKLTAADGEELDWFGISVGISGNTAIVGAQHDDDEASNAGAVYVFDVATGSELLKLTASDPFGSDFFGASVAIDGSTAIVGAWGKTTIGFGADYGAVYVFDVNPLSPTFGDELMKLVASDHASHDWFGYSVALDNGLATIGAPRNDDAGESSGSAYIFDVHTASPTFGMELFKLTASDADMDDWFGWSVGIDGNTAIIGAQGNSDSGPDSGSAYLFDVTTGNELLKITAPDAAAGDEFGASVAVEGDNVVIGAYKNDEAGMDAGAAYVGAFARPLGDINSDGTVGAADYTLWANAFGQMGVDLPADLNGNGTVDAADYTIWADNFGMMIGDGGLQAIPEPSALLLAGLGLIGLLVNRRWRRRWA